MRHCSGKTWKKVSSAVELYDTMVDPRCIRDEEVYPQPLLIGLSQPLLIELSPTSVDWVITKTIFDWVRVRVRVSVRYIRLVHGSDPHP